MPRTFHVSLRYAKSVRPPVSLTYKQMPITHRQARLAGREALVPEIVLKDYACNAVIDWIEVQVHLGRSTQHQWMRDAFDGFDLKPFIAPVDAGKGQESAQFRIKVQEPDLVRLRRILAAIERKYGQASEPLVVGMEVSVDFMPKKPSDEARARMVGVLFRHLAPSLSIFDAPQDAPRYSWGAKHRWARVQEGGSTPRDPYCFAVADGENVPGIDTTIYFGGKDAEDMVRVMDKVLDRQNVFVGTREVLAPEEKRCRIEVVLKQSSLEALGIRQLDDVFSFRFPTLQRRYFQFKLATVPVETRGPVAVYREKKRLEKFLATGISGLAKMDQTILTHSSDVRPQVRQELARRGKSLPGRPRISSGPYGTAVAYELLCKKVQTALANLSRSMVSQELEKRT